MVRALYRARTWLVTRRDHHAGPGPARACQRLRVDTRRCALNDSAARLQHGEGERPRRRYADICASYFARGMSRDHTGGRAAIRQHDRQRADRSVHVRSTTIIFGCSWRSANERWKLRGATTRRQSSRADDGAEHSARYGATAGNGLFTATGACACCDGSATDCAATRGCSHRRASSRCGIVPRSAASAGQRDGRALRWRAERTDCQSQHSAHGATIPWRAAAQRGVCA